MGTGHGKRNGGTVKGLDDPDGAALQVSDMIRDAVKPDLTMFVQYETLNENGKQMDEVYDYIDFCNQIHAEPRKKAKRRWESARQHADGY